MDGVLATKGTGIVTSVASDSPDDWATVTNLKKKHYPRASSATMMLVFIMPSEKTLPAHLNMELIKELQIMIASAIFTPRAFSIILPPTDASTTVPKAYKIRLTKVAEINPEVLHHFVKGDQSHDDSILTAITVHLFA
ncbi:uncharacterized protein EV420DRAFT_1650505 [Desarmillaria tabescens]|uniref:Uncharacterized protein n=1 Tax=Armillaria tabescens TaxID=1929756 RepID=A0AA39JCY8_ARMTA|nr:uncharacterized protein EV420DRAFT_1650505 [Desarmillaria tabescens]KAK0440485.1 hypothetical protein EV420DRAFT_1650505 [Desarmillaria tabescens]